MEKSQFLYQQQAMTYRDITPALLNEFVSFIDRSEKTARTYLINSKQFMAWLKYARVSYPQRTDIINYRDWLMSEHEAITFTPDTLSGWTYRTDSNGNPVKITCKPSTVKGYLQAVKCFFKWTAANNYYPDIAAGVHAPKLTNSHKKDSFTANEVLTIEQSIVQNSVERYKQAKNAKKDTAGRTQRATEQGARLTAIYLLAVNAGLRTIEISRANVKDLETKDGKTWLYIWGKGHAEADTKKPIAPEVAEAVKAYLQTRADSYTGTSPLFVSTGNRSAGQRIATTTISTMLKQAMKAAGFNSERLTAHSLRHTAAQNVLAITGDNIYKAQQYLRHADPKTTEQYLNNNLSEQEEVIAVNLYNSYHGIEASTDNRAELQSIITTLTPAQLEALTATAKAMQRA